MRCLVLLALVAAVAEGFCFSRTGYYLASKALAVGIGNITTHAACKYTGSAGIPLNDDCPPQCALLVRATWGDCYCSAPTFQPQVGDPPINSMSVQDIFAFFGKPSVTALQMQCRTWMQTPASMAMWQCNSTRTGVRIA